MILYLLCYKQNYKEALENEFFFAILHIKLSTSTYELIIFFYTFQTETEKGRKFLNSSTMSELCEALGKKDQFCKRQVSKAPYTYAL